MAVSESPAKGGDAIMGHRGKQFLRFVVCAAVLAYILTIKVC